MPPPLPEPSMDEPGRGAAGDSAFGRLDTRFGALGVSELKPFGEMPVEAPRPASAHALVDGDDVIDAVDAVDADLFPIFQEEAAELLPQLASRLRDWARKPGDAGHPAACMRTLHTLKGGARLAGAMRLGEMAHRLETRIERLLARPSVELSDVEDLQAHGDTLAQTFDALCAGDMPQDDATIGLVPPPAVVPPAPELEVLLEVAPPPAMESGWQSLPAPLVDSRFGSLADVGEPAAVPEPFDALTPWLDEPEAAPVPVADDHAPIEPIPLESARTDAGDSAAPAPIAPQPLAEVDWSRFPLSRARRTQGNRSCAGHAVGGAGAGAAAGPARQPGRRGQHRAFAHRDRCRARSRPRSPT